MAAAVPAGGSVWLRAESFQLREMGFIWSRRAVLQLQTKLSFGCAPPGSALCLRRGSAFGVGFGPTSAPRFPPGCVLPHGVAAPLLLQRCCG